MSPRTRAQSWRTAGGLATISLALVVAFYLLMEHTAHVFGALPYLLLLACPLLHLFHRGGHGRDHYHASAREDPR